jgi:hypothetical protein
MAVRQDVVIRDPAVEAAMQKPTNGKTVYERIDADRGLSPSQRKKRSYDAARTTATFDLPKTVIAELRRIAANEGVAVSGLASLMIQVGLREMQAERFGLGSYKRITRSLRFEWELVEFLEEAENEQN